MRQGAALLLAAVSIWGACSGDAEPHGSPVLIEVSWIAAGKPTLVWTLNPNPSLATVAPPAGQEVDFVFDRRLDGNRIEDTVADGGDEMTVAKPNPPISVSWSGASATTDPAFSDRVLYNSEPVYGGITAYAFLQPALVGFPAASTVTFSLDKTELTSAYGDQMTGPAEIEVATGPFSASFGLPAGANGDVSVPANFMLPIIFSNRAASAASIAPFVECTAGGVAMPFSLAVNASDPTIFYLSPASCPGSWPAGTPIEVTLRAGLPDAFGVGLAAPASASFTSTGAAASADGGCAAPDASSG
jgi:hypothetical protein